MVKANAQINNWSNGTSFKGDSQTDELHPLNVEKNSYGQYLFGSSYTDPNLPEGQGTAPNWSSYTTSRIMVRLFSRGLLGAAFYTLAHRWIPGQLKGYTAEGAIDATKPLQFLARGFDIAYGKPIQAYVKTYYRMLGRNVEEAASLARQATQFRNTKNFGTELEPIMGRSLGAEIVGMTTDFAAGSTGDAWGRQLATMVDPNSRNSWERDDGTTDWKQFGKATANAAWKIFSKNQGEDWAVALPYVYQMRYQRQAINKIFPGFAFVSDHQLNGGGWRMTAPLNEGGKILESYAKAGALDLQVRFTGYNIFTLMYRDFYDRVADAMKGEKPFFHKQATDQDVPKYHPAHSFLDGAAQAIRYATKSAIKATIYMTPAVPFFWITRTPQTKAHGLGVVFDPVQSAKDWGSPGPVDPFATHNTRGVFDRSINKVGKWCHEAAKPLNKAFISMGLTDKTHKVMYGHGAQKAFAEDFVNASASYTPYMIAKAETALRWDRPKDHEGLNEMDRAIYRFIDGVSSLDLKEISAGIGEIREEIIHPPSNREIEAKTRLQERQKALEELQGNKDEAPDTHVSDVTEETHRQKAQQEPASRSSIRQKAHRDFIQDDVPTSAMTMH